MKNRLQVINQVAGGLSLLLLGGLLNGTAAHAAIDFETQVKPILETSCYSCHGEKKGKGKLRLHTPDDLRAGVRGKKGNEPVVVPGQPEESTLYELIALPPDDSDVMPPEGDGDPLTKAQIALIKQWITEGANLGDGQKSVAPADPTAMKAIQDFGALALTLARDQPWIQVDFRAKAKELSDGDLKLLAPVADQVLWLSASKSQITDAGMAQIGQLKNLQRLDLNQTKITDAGLAHLTGLEELAYLNLYGCQITNAGLAHLAKLPRLKKIFLWQTKITEAAAKKALPRAGIVLEAKFKPILIEPMKPPVLPKETVKKEAAKPSINTVCPVTGKPVKDSTFSVVHKGHRIAFCGKDAVKQFVRDPDKYTGNLTFPKTSEKPVINTVCPVTGKPVKGSKLITVYEGHRIAFCGKKALAEFKKDPKKYAGKLTLPKTSEKPVFNTVCPVTGKPVKGSKLITVYEGHRIAFCGKKALAQFKKDPKKYAGKLNLPKAK